MLIKNTSELTSKGNVEGRKIVLKIVEEALEKVNYFNIIKETVQLEKDVLTIKDFKLNLDNFRNIFLIGGGKYSSFMTSALEEILGDRITEGIVIEKKGHKGMKKRIAFTRGGHPLPDSDSIKSADRIIKIVTKAKQNDLVIVCVSGGWTALTSKPPEGVTLKELQKTYELLFNSGMIVEQMNIIRNYLSPLGRGKIPMMTNHATIIGLIVVDEVEDKPWGPTVYDSTTSEDAIQILKNFDLLEKIPLPVKKYLVKITSEKKTSRGIDWWDSVRVHNFVVVDNKTLCKAAQRAALNLGVSSFILSTSIRGEAKDVGKIMASISKEISRYGRPFKPPCVIISGGETTVKIIGKPGKGGRNQEMALSVAQEIQGVYNIVIACTATDGTDGPTEIAGAVVDGTTSQRAEEEGLNVTKELINHNSSSVFEKISDAIYMFDTATNLMDLTVIYVA